MIEIRWHGRGGQGSFTASKLLGASAALYGGRHALSFPSFGPERRGAPVLAFTKIDDKKIVDRSEVRKCDFIVVLDETLFSESFFNDLKSGGRIIINSSNKEAYSKYDPKEITTVDATNEAIKLLGKPITNTAMLGALIAVSDMISLDAVLKGMEGFLKGSLLKKNMELVERLFLQSKEAAI